MSSILEHGVVTGSHGRGPLAIGRLGRALPRVAARTARHVESTVYEPRPWHWFAKRAALGILLGIAVALLVI